MLEIFNFCVIIISNYDFTAALNNFFRFSLKNKLKFYLLRLSKRHYIMKFNKNTIFLPAPASDINASGHRSQPPRSAPHSDRFHPQRYPHIFHTEPSVPDKDLLTSVPGGVRHRGF